MKLKDVAQKAKVAVRKTIAPTNEDRYEQARKIQAKNKIKEEKVRSMEAVYEARKRAVRLQERERKARVNPTWGTERERASSQKVARAYSMGKKDPFEVFNSPLFGGVSNNVNKSAKKGKKKEKSSDFPDFNFL